MSNNTIIRSKLNKDDFMLRTIEMVIIQSIIMMKQLFGLKCLVTDLLVTRSLL